MTAEQVERLLTWIILGVILGGRLGYVLFYDLRTYLAEPGRSCGSGKAACPSTAGFWGGRGALLVLPQARSIPLLSMADLLAVATPPGLLLGRLANFINAELWGRPTTTCPGA
jgi:phosphatidylglycerol---prolipoprotein diacylglyceryl transferase